ncbi:MAG TPA: hypothetical protein VLB80_00350 [Candidatus Babeliales bacterium]|nr:hypothetical protein [Candidatus Babeliales bacterium]
MKLYYYIGIHLIAQKNINIQKLSTKLDNYIQRSLPDTHIILEANSLYWKEPESNNIIYSILNNHNIKISDLLTLFPLSWNYSEGYVYNVEIQQQVNNEEAIWSQLCHPEEVFLMPEVEWVHIYTWEITEEPIVIN